MKTAEKPVNAQITQTNFGRLELATNVASIEPPTSRLCKVRPRSKARFQRRITPQFSGRALPCEARRERIMKWRARAVAATPYHGPLQLLVMRWHHASSRPRNVHSSSASNASDATLAGTMLLQAR